MHLFIRWRVRPFVILFIERDGSTYLSGLLQGHPDVRAAYERFAAMRQEGRSGKEQNAWARQFLSPPLIGHVAAIGFKTKLVDVLDREGFAEVLRRIGCRLIVMRRRNHVKAVVSRINARRLHETTGKWNLYRREDRLPPIVVDPVEFEAYLQERKAHEQDLEDFVDGLPSKRLPILYEDLLTKRDETLDRVFEFLGVRPHSLEARTLKHTSDDLRDVVVNLDDLRARYIGTHYEPMFGEILVPAA